MPTIGIQPNPLSTHAVGAALLHQFALDRFREAGLTEDLIQEAEENLDPQTSELLSLPNEPNETDRSINTSGRQNDLTSSFSYNNDSQNLEGPLNSTQKPNTSAEDQYLSIRSNSNIPTANGADTSTNEILSSTINNGMNNNTEYHSINASRLAKSGLDRLQSSSIMIVYGRELRQIAEEFARSRQRQTVREQANGVSLQIFRSFRVSSTGGDVEFSSTNFDVYVSLPKQVKLENINKQSFLELLDELFAGGITREKIAVLFFFCTDVALRAASMAQDLVVKLLCWSFSFIINTVCKRVDELGGWDRVLFDRVPSFLLSCLTILGICAVLTYLHKSLRSS